MHKQPYSFTFLTTAGSLFWALTVFSCGEETPDPRIYPLPPEAVTAKPDGGVVVTEKRKRVFVTSSRFNGNLKLGGRANSGLEGADNLCQTVARGANLPGTYKAWLSSGTADAIDRIADVGPWYQVTDTGTWIKTFNNKSNLLSRPLEGLSYDEQGRRVSMMGSTLWTGTNTFGLRTARHCDQWSSDMGFNDGSQGETSYQPSERWSESGDDRCNELNALLCFEQ